MISEARKRTGEFSGAVLVSQAVRPSLDHAGFVVQPLGEAERHPVVGLRAQGHAVPVPIDHLGNFSVPQLHQTVLSSAEQARAPSDR